MAIHLSHHDEIALITLDRPEALNALSFGQLHDLNRILDSIAGGKSRALLVTGAGDRAFSAGADIKELMDRSLVEQRAGALLGQSVLAKVDQAERIGLVNRLVDGDLVEAGMCFAREMTGFSLPVLGLARDAIRRALDLPLPEGLKIEADLSTLAFQTADSVEGMTAFIEKRKPVFRDG